MRLTHGALFLCASLVALASSRAAGDNPPDNSVLRLRVVTDAGAADGTCVLIHREDRGTDAVLYFLTSSHLFRGLAGEPSPRIQAVRVLLDGEHTLDVRLGDTFVPGGTLIDVAVFRATTTSTTLVGRPAIYQAPSVGEVFLIAGYEHGGAAATVAERVRFQSTLVAVGDRDASTLVGCLGAPAISRDGVFGVVSECNVGRAPVIALLSMARSFIERYVPRPVIPTSAVPQFDVVDRQIAGPLVLVGCDAINTGEVDVPLGLGPREWAIDATAAFVNPHEVRLGEVTVLKLQDRFVRLRFSLGGVPSPPSPPASCPQGQALVTVRVNVAVARTPE